MEQKHRYLGNTNRNQGHTWSVSLGVTYDVVSYKSKPLCRGGGIIRHGTTGKGFNGERFANANGEVTVILGLVSIINVTPSLMREVGTRCLEESPDQIHCDERKQTEKVVSIKVN